MFWYNIKPSPLLSPLNEPHPLSICPLEKCKLFRKFAALREGNVLYWSVVWQATGVGGEILQVDATHFYPHWQTKSLDVFKKTNI